MRIYIIGNDGITLCREPPSALNDGEIAVASNEELHAARLSGKRLLALWNAFPGVEKRRKVGDREALIDQLWSAVEALPDPDTQSDAKRPSKQDAVISMLQRPEGATVDEVASAMAWQRHTVRGFFSGTLKKKLRLTSPPPRGARPGLPHCRAAAGMSRAIQDERLAGRRFRASPSSISASFVSAGAHSTKPMHPRISAASCWYERLHTGCRSRF